MNNCLNESFISKLLDIELSTNEHGVYFDKWYSNGIVSKELYTNLIKRMKSERK